MARNRLTKFRDKHLNDIYRIPAIRRRGAATSVLFPNNTVLLLVAYACMILHDKDSDPPLINTISTVEPCW